MASPNARSGRKRSKTRRPLRLPSSEARKLLVQLNDLRTRYDGDTFSMSQIKGFAGAEGTAKERVTFLTQWLECYGIWGPRFATVGITLGQADEVFTKGQYGVGPGAYKRWAVNAMRNPADYGITPSTEDDASLTIEEIADGVVPKVASAPVRTGPFIVRHRATRLYAPKKSTTYFYANPDGNVSWGVARQAATTYESRAKALRSIRAYADREDDFEILPVGRPEDVEEIADDLETLPEPVADPDGPSGFNDGSLDLSEEADLTAKQMRAGLGIPEDVEEIGPNQWFTDSFPVCSHRYAEDSHATLQLVLREGEALDYANVTLRLVTWDLPTAEGDIKTINNIIEQAVVFPDPTNCERNRNYIMALLDIASELLAHHPVGLPIPKMLLAPLHGSNRAFAKTHPIWLKTPQTVADFDKALRAKSRLGKYLA